MSKDLIPKDKIEVDFVEKMLEEGIKNDINIYRHSMLYDYKSEENKKRINEAFTKLDKNIGTIIEKVFEQLELEEE